LAVAAACGALIAAPALADVTVTPTTAAQGSGENFTFHVTNTGTTPIGTVQLKIPADTPVAEVYPLSVDDWAPKIDERKLSSPLPTVHGGIPADEATSAITWIAMPGRALKPGQSTDLSIAIGPMPTLSSMRFTLAATYTNGKPGPAMSPASVTLTPATAQQLADEHAGHDEGAGTTADDPDAAENAQFAKVVADATRGPSIFSILGWIVAAAGLLGGIGLMIRSRHRAEEEDEPEDDEATTAGEPTATADEPKAAADEPKRAADEPKAAGDDSETAGEDAKQPVAAGKWSLKE
jgi:hypothetical protein